MASATLYSIVLLFSLSSCAKLRPTDKFDYVSPASEKDLLKQDKNYWYYVGNDYLRRILKFDDEPKRHVAKNVIIFIGDGMGLSTTTAARIYKGQRNVGTFGEEYNLAYDNFPNVALVKTYNVDMQVPDSAATATAIFTGIKTRYEAIGLDALSTPDKFDRNIFEKSKVESLMSWAQKANKDTGIVTTTRISHATPAATYAHANYRYWECDSQIPDFARNEIKDISRQLVEDYPGRNFKVILGGGLQELGYMTDVEGGECVRNDGRNLTDIWLKKHNSSRALFVTNTEQLNQVDDKTEYLLGLFAPDHMPFELMRNKNGNGTPSLTEMTKKALKILKKSDQGYVLMVEGGLIDRAHHKNYARLALAEAAELDEAINLAVHSTGPDTLIIVTADHTHSLTLNGYAKRGNDILGYGITTRKFKPLLTLTYANGPGFTYQYAPNEGNNETYPWRDSRRDPLFMNEPDYQHIAAYYLPDESHGGEDVAIYAKGPGSHLIRGVIEQNVIAHVVSYAACIGPHATTNEHCYNVSSLLKSCNFVMLGNLIFIVILYTLFK